MLFKYNGAKHLIYSKQNKIKLKNTHNLKLENKNWIWKVFSAVKWLIAINRIQNKCFCLHNMCVYCVYLLCIYKYTHIYVYI